MWSAYAIVQRDQFTKNNKIAGPPVLTMAIYLGRDGDEEIQHLYKKLVDENGITKRDGLINASS